MIMFFRFWSEILFRKLRRFSVVFEEFSFDISVSSFVGDFNLCCWKGSLLRVSTKSLGVFVLWFESLNDSLLCFFKAPVEGERMRDCFLALEWVLLFCWSHTWEASCDGVWTDSEVDEDVDGTGSLSDWGKVETFVSSLAGTDTLLLKSLRCRPKKGIFVKNCFNLLLVPSSLVSNFLFEGWISPLLLLLSLLLVVVVSLDLVDLSLWRRINFLVELTDTSVFNVKDEKGCCEDGLNTENEYFCYKQRILLFCSETYFSSGDWILWFSEGCQVGSEIVNETRFFLSSVRVVGWRVTSPLWRFSLSGFRERLEELRDLTKYTLLSNVRLVLSLKSKIQG